MSSPTFLESLSNNVSTKRIPQEMRCKYNQTACYNERAIKENGDRHNLCVYHRNKANAAQRRSAKKKRDESRREFVLQFFQERISVKGVPEESAINPNFQSELILSPADIITIDEPEYQDDFQIYTNKLFNDDVDDDMTMHFTEDEIEMLLDVLLSA